MLAGGDGGVGVAPEGGGGLAHVARAAVKAPGAATPEIKQLLSLEDKTTKYAAWNPHIKIFIAKYSCLPKYLWRSICVYQNIYVYQNIHSRMFIAKYLWQCFHELRSIRKEA